MKSSPWQEHFARLSVFLGLLASAASCVDTDEPDAVRVTAQFQNSVIALSENEGEKSISLFFNRPVPADGEIILKATAVESACFSTSPIAELGQIRLAVSRGDQNVSFTMRPTDNANLDGEKIVTFSIVSMSDVFVAGTTREAIVNVHDDEAPVHASFAASHMNLRENVSDATLEINLAYPAPADGVLVLTAESLSTYGVEYATEPAAASGNIFLPVSKGSTSAVVGLYAVNDNVFKGDRDIHFTLVDASGGVVVGPNEFMTVTITDDDGYLLSPISDVRAKYNGESLTFNEDIYVEGIVTSVDNVASGRVVIEDRSGALPIQLSSDKKPKRGDFIVVNLKQGTLREVQGIMEVGSVAGIYSTLGEGDVNVTKVTIEDLLISNDRFESFTVVLTGVTFPEADGISTLEGDRILSDGIHTIIVRTGANTAFAGDLLPDGQVNVTGIVANYDGVYVLYPQERKDIKKPGALIRK